MLISKEFLEKNFACNGYSAWFEKNQMYDQPDAVIINLLIQQKHFHEANWLLSKCLKPSSSLLYVYTAIIKLESSFSAETSSARTFFDLIKNLYLKINNPGIDQLYINNILNIYFFAITKHLLNKMIGELSHPGELYMAYSLNHYVEAMFFNVDLDDSRLAVLAVVDCFKYLFSKQESEKIYLEILERGVFILKHYENPFLNNVPYGFSIT